MRKAEYQLRNGIKCEMRSVKYEITNFKFHIPHSKPSCFQIQNPFALGTSHFAFKNI